MKKARFLSGTGTPVKGFLKKRIQNTVCEYVGDETAHGRFLVCTDIDGAARQLFFQRLHKNVMRNRHVFICTGDFVDAEGNDCTINFTVAEGDDGLYVEGAEVHFLMNDDRQGAVGGPCVLKVA